MEDRLSSGSASSQISSGIGIDRTTSPTATSMLLERARSINKELEAAVGGFSKIADRLFGPAPEAPTAGQAAGNSPSIVDEINQALSVSECLLSDLRRVYNRLNEV